MKAVYESILALAKAYAVSEYKAPDTTKVELQVGSHKEFINLADLVQALGDAVYSGNYWLDEVNDYVYDIESDLNRAEETLKDIREVL